MIATTMPRLRTVIAVAALAAAGAGCKKKVDTKDAETKIGAWAKEYVGPVSSVKCESAELKAGATFPCKVTFEGGGTYVLDVEQKDDKGNVEWKWRTQIVGADKVAKLVTDAIREQGGGADTTVDCGQGIKEMPAEGITCQIAGGGEQAELLVKVEGDGLAWEIKQ